MNNLKGKTIKNVEQLGDLLVIHFTDGTGLRVVPKVNNDLSPGIDVATWPFKPGIDTSQFIGLSK